MSTHFIEKGQTLSEIVQQKYQLKGWANIYKKCQEIQKVNNIENMDLIFAGNTLELPDEEGSQAPANTDSFEKSNEEPPAQDVTQPADSSSQPPPAVEEPPAEEETVEELEITSEEPEEELPPQAGIIRSKDMSFGDWTIKTMKDTIEGSETEDYVFESPEYIKDLKENEAKNAFSIYQKDLTALAEQTISASDAGVKDGRLDFDEFAAQEEGDYKKATGESEMPPGSERLTKIGFKTLDLNGDKFIDKEEEAAFLAYADYNKNTETYDERIPANKYIGLSQALAEPKTKDKLKAKLIEIRDTFFPKQ